MSNSLIHETSPYLLQHADNPVRWYSWNNNSLHMAKRENKPIFLSIGYSSCHWCHVMAHESFENNNTAKIMNKYFINIKVDREERPDIDDIYQKICQSVNGQGGWPLSVFLTPEQKPFYITTYIPSQKSYGRPSFKDLLMELAKQWTENKQKFEQTAKTIISNVQHNKLNNNKIDKSILDEAFVNLSQISDYINGGFGHSPKFPNVMNLSFILRYSRFCNISKFNNFVFKTLIKMASGGIFDKLDGGFHRYSTDERWFVPHFEKMLYDNSLLPLIYAEAYQLTKNKYYLEILLKTMDYVLSRLLSPEGGFYSSQDADYEGEEGKYYLWTKQEIVDVIKDHADIFCMYYNVTTAGNFEGRNILYNSISLHFIASKFGISENEASKIIHDCENKLLKSRLQRHSPFLDDKIITSWNALTISALIKTYKITKDKKFKNTASRCIDFIISRLIQKSQLLHIYKNKTAKIHGYLDDYSYFINSLIDFFEINPSSYHLQLACDLAKYMIKHFWDGDNNFFMTADVAEELIIRPKNNYDLSLPSGNSVAAYALLRLYHLTGLQIFYDSSQKIMESNCDAAASNPFAYGYLLNTIYIYLKKPTEIVIINDENDSMSDLINKSFIPEAISINISTENQLKNLTNYHFFAGKEYTNHSAAYVCKNYVCSLPLTKMEELKNYM